MQNEDPETIHLRKQVLEIIQSIDPVISMHDFRIVKGPTHSNLIFDVVIPMKFSMTPEGLTQAIDQAVKKINPDYYTVINVDRDYAEA